MYNPAVEVGAKTQRFATALDELQHSSQPDDWKDVRGRAEPDAEPKTLVGDYVFLILALAQRKIILGMRIAVEVNSWVFDEICYTDQIFLGCFPRLWFKTLAERSDEYSTEIAVLGRGVHICQRLQQHRVLARSHGPGIVLENVKFLAKI